MSLALQALPQDTVLKLKNAMTQKELSDKLVVTNVHIDFVNGDKLQYLGKRTNIMLAQQIIEKTITSLGES